MSQILTEPQEELEVSDKYDSYIPLTVRRALEGELATIFLFSVC